MKPRILVLYADVSRTLSYYDDWRDAFLSHRDFEAGAINICNSDAVQQVDARAREVDLIVLLHSTNADTLQFANPLQAVLASRTARVLSFVGNEVNLPGCWMADKIAFLREIRPDWIATQLPLAAGRYLYDGIAPVIAIPHALNPVRFAPRTPLDQRFIDIGVRSYRYLAALGDDERNRILSFFEQTKFDPPLAVDILTDESSRLTAEQWPVFLNSLKATISTEAGSYYLERDDRTLRAILAHLEKQHARGLAGFYHAARKSALRKLVPASIRRRMAQAVEASSVEQKHRSLSALDNSLSNFKDLHDRFFRNYQNPVSGKCISSRHFDAAGTKTLQIMFPGEFNGILEADVHYVALRKDFSNADDTIARLRDPSFRKGMVDAAYDHVMSGHTYTHRMKQVMELIG